MVLLFNCFGKGSDGQENDRSMQQVVLLVFVIVVVTVSPLFSQSLTSTDKGIIHGTVLDSSTNTPTEYANMVAYRQSDSVQVGGDIVDKNGHFRITDLPPGTYFIEAGFIGYKTKYKDDLRITSKNSSVGAGVILLKVSSLNSKEIVVQGQHSQMELRFEKRIFQVGTDITSLGGSVLDVLNNVPSLQTDFKGNISLRGSNAVRVLINGKPSTIYQNGSRALQNLPANMIKEIQVITNSSAKYEAEGSAGIINIVLKKKHRHGFHGSVGMMQRYPEATQLSSNLNYRVGQVNWFANGSIAYNNDPAHSRTYQRFHSPDTAYIYRAYNNGNETDYHGNLELGAEWHLTTKQTVTASALSHFENKKDLWNGAYIDSTTNGQFLDQVKRHNRIGGGENETEFSLEYQHQMDGDRHNLDANIDYETGTEKELPHIREINLLSPADTVFHNISDVRKSHELRFEADYVSPIADSGKIETGVQSRHNWRENLYNTKERRQGAWNILPAFNDNFATRDHLNAAYATLSSNFGSLGYQIGIRAEQYSFQISRKDTSHWTKQSYTDLFPSIFLTYKFNKQRSMQTSYSRRISRPWSRLLLPTVNYSDSRSRFTGNPDLKPEYVNSYEAQLLQYWDTGSLLVSVYSRHRTSVIERISSLNTSGILLTTPINLATEDAWGIELTADKEFTDHLKLSGSLNAFKSTSNGNYQDKKYSATTNRLTSRIGVHWEIFQGFKYQGYVRYYGPAETIQGHRSSNVYVNMAIAKALFDGKATLSLSSEDLFNTRREEFTVTDPQYFSSQKYWEPSGIRLNFVYRINQEKGTDEGD